MIPGPKWDASRGDKNGGLVRYARAVQEALRLGPRLAYLVHIPMCHENQSNDNIETIASLLDPVQPQAGQDVDAFASWDAWNTIREVCAYNLRLYIGMLYSPFTC